MLQYKKCMMAKDLKATALFFIALEECMICTVVPASLLYILRREIISWLLGVSYKTLVHAYVVPSWQRPLV
jgi:hypothetical protein